MGTVTDAVLRLVDPQIPVVPWRSFQSPSDDEAAAIDTLGRSGYRIQLPGWALLSLAVRRIRYALHRSYVL